LGFEQNCRKNPYTYVGVSKLHKFCAPFIRKFLPSTNSLSGNSYLNTKTKMAFFFIHSYKKLEFTMRLNIYLSKLTYWFMLFVKVCWSCKRFGNKCLVSNIYRCKVKCSWLWLISTGKYGVYPSCDVAGCCFQLKGLCTRRVKLLFGRCLPQNLVRNKDCTHRIFPRGCSIPTLKLPQSVLTLPFWSVVYNYLIFRC